MTMKIFRASVLGVVLGGESSVVAFGFSPPIDVHPSSSSVYVQSRGPSAVARMSCLDSRRCIAQHMSQSYHEQEETSPTASVGTSRRAALRQCSSIFTAAIASAWGRQEAANASEFSDGPEPQELMPPVQKNAPPQFSDETVITPARPQVVLQQKEEARAPTSPSPDSSVAASSGPSSLTAQVTLENSQVVTIPVRQVPVAYSPESNQASPAPTSSTAQANKGSSATATVGVTGVALAAIGSAVLGRVTPNTDTLSPKAKVVMITPEPYGLATGRRYYNGVDITVNDPIPASDVRKYCDAGKVNNDCTETIAGFLGEVQSNSKNGVESPSVEQQETANAVLSYLDSLAPARSAPSHSGDSSSQTSVAFTSYLNGLSNGEIAAPASPQLVADYLSSLSDMQSRMDSLETSMNRMPDEISGRLQDWQEGQDERLAKEFIKIEEHLIKMENKECDIGYDVPSIDLNGVVVNGESESSTLPVV